MTDLIGVGVGVGTVFGPVIRMPDPSGSAPPRGAEDAAAELSRSAAALRSVAAELRRRAAVAGPVGSGILDAQALMAEDPVIHSDIEVRTAAGQTAEQAIDGSFAGYRALLLGAGDYLAARAADVDDVARRAVAACTGSAVAEPPAPGHPYVLVARDLSPADTALLDMSIVLALVTEEGGPTSHTAILARARGIPAVVACRGAGGLADGTAVLVHASAGTVVVDPADDLVAAARVTSAVSVTSAHAEPGPAVARPGRTADGHPVALLANVGGPADLGPAHGAGAEGVGLLRTEFLFMHRENAPDTAEQTAAYREMLEGFPGQTVVARVLDAGADKPMACLPRTSPEPNPALGVRGLRALRAHEAVLDMQLESLAEAAHGLPTDLWVMAPMVADVEDARWFVERARPFGFAAVGVMVEVPAAALTADQLVDAVDFVSIGTNDLAQYTLAADRMLGAVGALLDPWHPAVLRLVRMVAEAGAAAGKPVGVCGEAAGDPILACALAGVGVTSLSMSPSAIAPVRAELATRTADECAALADALLRTGTARAARAAGASWRGSSVRR